MNLMNPICVSGKNYQEAGPQVRVLQVQTPYASPHQTYQAFRTWRWQKTQGSNDSILKFEKTFFQIWIFGRRFLLVFMVVLLWKKYNPPYRAEKLLIFEVFIEIPKENQSAICVQSVQVHIVGSCSH